MQVGDVYGQLTLLSPTKAGDHKAFLCRCTCGVRKVVRRVLIRDGAVKSCGCLLRKRRPPEDRFQEKVETGSPESCWGWKGYTDGRGYARFWLEARKPVLAHRFAWEMVNGPIPEGLLVCHRCDNPSCCNPAHLFLGTHSDNSQDMVEKGRHRNGASK